MAFKMIDKTNKQKNKRYWLRGGVVGGVIGILIFAINYFLKESFFMIFVAPIGLILMLFGDLNKENFILGGIIAILLIFIFYFLLGTIIGYIYGKIKQRRTKQ